MGFVFCTLQPKSQKKVSREQVLLADSSRIRKDGEEVRVRVGRSRGNGIPR